MRRHGVPDGIYSLAAAQRVPSDAPFTVRELLDRPDAEETFARVAAVVSPDAPDPDLVVTLTGLAVLRARAAAERAAG